VVFNTASDSFQTHPRILEVAYDTMKVLLERGIGFSFLTKGWIPSRFIKLFSSYRNRVTSRIGLVSMSQRYRDLFEPHAATVEERLENIERLKGEGIEVEVRIDPIIPFYTDDEVSIKRLYEALAARDIRSVSLSYLHLRPAILDQIQGELPPTAFNILRSCFEIQPWTTVGASARSKLTPLALREKGYGRFLDLSKDFGITALICSCKNPDMSAQICTPGIRIEQAGKPPGEKGRQLTLFP
jgi:hypothetical protein